MHRTRQRRTAGAALVCALLAASTACGTSLPRQEIERAAGVSGSAVSAGGEALQSGDVTGSEGSADLPSAPAAGSAPGSGAAAADDVPAAGSAPTGRTAGGATAPRGATRSGTATSPGAPGAPGQGAPITIAAVSTLGGATGEAVRGVTEAVQAWTGSVNARGGVGGHRIKLVVVDDGGDTNRHLQLVKQMVEKFGAVALVGSAETSTQSQQAVSYLERKGVPTIGDDASNAFGYRSPMVFPAVPAGPYYSAAIAQGFASLAKKEGLKKIALVTCVEASICQTAFSSFEKDMGRVGLDPVYKTQTSITQPDFTAQCIQARNAGAELVSVGMDFNSVRRVVTSCRQQGYRPRFITPAVGPGMEKEDLWQGVYIGWMSFSPFVGDTPAVREFRAAMASQQPDVSVNLEHAVGWSGAKLFERALQKAELGSGPVRSADVLRGLWALEGERLGGLTGPLTFTRGETATPVFCFLGITIERKEFVNPTGSSPTCTAAPRL